MLDGDKVRVASWSANKMAAELQAKEAAVSNFRDYLRIKTVQPNPDIEGAIAFLKRQATDIGLDCNVVEAKAGYPVVVLTWKGTDSNCCSVMLNSHMDVVPVFPEHWKYDPFSAHMEDNGDIYARGTQDMKCVGIQYIEAVRRLKKEGRSFLRTIHLTFMPDEEIGGDNGMSEFVKTPFFAEMNVGFALDEGLASPDDTISVFYCERSFFWFEVNFPGNPGHGSRFIENTAVAKLHKFMTAVLSFREAQKTRLESDPSKSLGDVTSVNITKLQGGVQSNVVPSEMSLSVDMRVTPSEYELMESKLQSWVADAGEGATVTKMQKKPKIPPTSISSEDPWWMAFQQAMDDLGLKVRYEIFSAGTDAAYLRLAGIPALGFSPMPHTPILLHDHNEFLNKEVFLKGIAAYECLLPALASVTTKV